MTYPFKSVSEYNDHMQRKQRLISTRQLLAEARQVAAWGVPDGYSVGYSPQEMCNMINQLVRKIEELDSLVQLNKSPTS